MMVEGEVRDAPSVQKSYEPYLYRTIRTDNELPGLNSFACRLTYSLVDGAIIYSAVGLRSRDRRCPIHFTLSLRFGLV